MNYIVMYFATGIIFFLIDFLWLGTIAKSFYQKHIGTLLLEQFNIAAAIGFYAVYFVGIVIFAVAPAVASGKWSHALVYGALFGFFTYMTYDMTNLATLKNWSTTVVIVDILWGTFLAGTAATSAYHISKLIH